MLRTLVELNGWRIETWECSRQPDLASRDDLLISVRPSGFRIVVIDGVTPTEWTPGPEAVDPGVWAASLVRATFSMPASLEACASAANAALRDTTPVKSPRDHPQAAFVAIDMTNGARVVRGGDCECWVERDGSWRRTFPRDVDTPAERARMLSWTARHPDVPYSEYDRARPESSDIWSSAALGRLPHLVLQSEAINECTSIVLATDGARLDDDALTALPEWLEDIQDHQRHHPVSIWEGGPDDVSVVRLRSIT